MAWFSMSNATVQLSRPGLTWSKRRHCRALSLLSEQTVSVSEQRLSTSAQYQNLIYQLAELHRLEGQAVWYLALFNYRKQVSLKIKSEFGRNFLTRQQKMLCFLPCSPYHCKMIKVSLCLMLDNPCFYSDNFSFQLFSGESAIVYESFLSVFPA